MRSKEPTTLGDAYALRRRALVVVTRSRGVAPLTPTENVRRLESTPKPLFDLRGLVGP